MSWQRLIEDDFCYYCQKRFASPENFRRHLSRVHYDTHVCELYEEAVKEAEQFYAAARKA